MSDAGLQHERTALAWERTAIAAMVAGVALVRFSAVDGHIGFGVFGLVQTLGGGALLWWAAYHDAELHNPASPASAVPRLALTRVVGMASVLASVVALVAAVVVIVVD